MEKVEELIDTTRVSRSRSFRISLPKRVAERLNAAQDDIIGFYSNDSGEIVLKKLR